MYHASYHPRRRSSVFIPFLMLVTIGLAAVLVYQLWSYFHEQAVQKRENKAAITVVSGRAEMLIFAQKQWVTAATNGVLREGDSIRVFPNSRVSLALLNGGFVRLDGDTEASITALKTKDREDMISLDMARGEMWLKKTKSEAVKTSFSVSTADLTARTIGTIFQVSKRDDTRVSVIEGKVALDLKNEENGKVRVIDTLEVGVGQEAVISKSAMEAFRRRENPDVIFAISDLFRGSEWYAWNMKEDVLASSVTVQEAVSQKTVTEPPLVEQNVSSGSEEVLLERLAPPVVAVPDKNSLTSKDAKVIIRGTTSEQTQKIIVSTFTAGKKDSYALKKYAPGSIEWSYIASADLRNYVPGSNRYEIIAVNKDGKESEKTILNLFFEKEKEPAVLSVPTISTFNGEIASGNQYETCTEPIVVEGKIGKGIVKVVVNDFALTRYVPNSERWSYKAQASFGNLKEGENSYEVYGADSYGTKTPVTKFSITKCATPPPSAPMPTPTPAPTATPTSDASNSASSTPTMIEVNATEAPPQ